MEEVSPLEEEQAGGGGGVLLLTLLSTPSGLGLCRRLRGIAPPASRGGAGGGPGGRFSAQKVGAGITAAQPRIAH